MGPSSLEVDGPDAAVTAGDAVTLTCTISGAKPAANATWFNRSDALDVVPRTRVDLAADGTFTTVSVVEVAVSRHDHRGTYYCKGSNSVLQSKGEAPLLKSLDIEVLCKSFVRLFLLFLMVFLVNLLSSNIALVKIHPV